MSEQVAADPAASPLRGRMVFVVGVMRSGTNWLQRVLCSHPDIVGLPTETHLFRWLDEFASHVQHGVPGSYRVGYVYAERQRFLEAMRGLCDALFAGYLPRPTPSEGLVLERTPDHAWHLELMSAVYPDARYIHIVRDGRDVVRSLRRQWWWSGRSVTAGAAQWRRTIEHVRAIAPALARYREVRYEDLLAWPEEEIAGLFEWLGVPSDSAVIAAALAEAGVPYNVDPTAPRVGAMKWREEWTSDDVVAFEQEAGRLRAQLGYAEAAPISSSRVGAAARAAAGGMRRLVRRGAPARAAASVLDLTDDLLDAMARGSPEVARALFRPDAFVRLVGPEVDWSGRGAEAVGRLLEELQLTGAHPVARGDVHPGVTTATVVSTGADGAQRVLVVSATGDGIERVVHYRSA